MHFTLFQLYSAATEIKQKTATLDFRGEKEYAFINSKMIYLIFINFKIICISLIINLALIKNKNLFL